MDAETGIGGRGRVGLATGLWTSVAGASAQSQHVDSIANNLANADTLGFKKDAPTFKEYMASVEREHAVTDIPRGPIKDKDTHPIDGRDQAFVVVDGTYTNFRQGTLKVTKSPLDVALDGPGFLEVSTPNGIRYTRQGSLKMATDGRLVTSEGFPVLSAQAGGLSAQVGGPNAAAQPGQGGSATQGGVGAGQTADAARFINLLDAGGMISISEEGEVYGRDGSLVARLSVAEFADTRKLRKSGGTLFDNPDPTNRKPMEKTVVRQGVIETSNVNPVEEMTNLIKANRLFEQDLKAMKTYSDMIGREANDIGKL